MKGTSAAMVAHMRGSLASMALCWKITKNEQVGNEVLTWTDHDAPILDPTDGLLYVPIPGVSQSDIVSDVSLSADNLSVTAGLVAPNPTLDTIRAGDWSNAFIEMFYLCWRTPSKGRHFLKCGTIGRIGAGLVESQSEVRGLLQAWSASVGDVTQAGCRHRFGDGSYLMGGCNNDDTTNPDDFNVTGTLDTVSADQITLESSAFVELSPPPASGAGSFNNGYIVIEDDDDANNGRRRDIKYSEDGLIKLQEAFPYALVAGVTFRAFYGCDKWGDTCRDTYNNYNNFDGEEWLPGTDKMLQVGRT